MIAFKIAFDSLKEHPLRASLATLGVTVGVASLVAVLAVGDGMENYARERMKKEGYQSILVTPVEMDTVDGVPIRRPYRDVLTPADVDALSRLLPSGTAVTLKQSGVTTIANANVTAGAFVNGLYPEAALASYTLKQGRMLTDDELAGERCMTLLSEKLAARIAATPGTRLSFTTGVQCEVAGVVGVRENDPANLAIVPPAVVVGTTLSNQIGTRGAAIEATTPQIEKTATTRAQIEQWVARRFDGTRREVRVNSVGASRLEDLKRGVLLFKLFMGAIVGISLLVGGIGVMNVLLASVSERTREIGIRKAAGATNRNVMSQFMAESVVMVMMGAIVGIVVGLGASLTMTAVMRRVAEAQVYAAVEVPTVLLALSIVAVVGVIFGSYPALRAARLSPIEAIRHET